MLHCQELKVLMVHMLMDYPLRLVKIVPMCGLMRWVLAMITIIPRKTVLITLLPLGNFL